MVIVVMGVSGCGKTTVGLELARLLDADFIEGDDFHPPGNVVKMKAGIPLDDRDRWPWLRTLSAAVEAWTAGGRDVVLACSALKQAYREALGVDGGDVRLVYLKGGAELIRRRLGERHDHFMPAGLLESQLAALEEPSGAVGVGIEDTPQAIAAEIQRRLDRRK